jgi:two-component system phosphate regulon response regulator PhoB
MGTGRPVALIVDDNVGFLRVVRRLLAGDSDGFEVHTVETGDEALAFVERRVPFVDAPRPSFVVLDFHLPDMDAPEIVSRIRSRPDTAAVPLLVISQANWPEDQTAAVQAGCDRFCVKPSDLDELRGTIVQFWREVASRSS